MLTQQFLTLVRGLLAELEEHSSAQAKLAEIGNEYEVVANEHDALLTAPANVIGDRRNAVNLKLKEAATRIATIDLFDFSRHLDGIQKAVEGFLSEIPLRSFSSLDRIKVRFGEFKQDYQRFLQFQHKPEDTSRIIVMAKAIAELLGGIKESFEVVEGELEYKPPPDTETLTLAYDDTPDLERLLALLAALLAIWQEICREVDVDPKPPFIARLETGSCVLMLVGSPFGIAALTLLVTHWHRIKDFLDPVGSSSTAIGAALNLATLSDFMRSRDMNTDNLDKSIARIAQSQAAKLQLATNGIVKVSRNDSNVAIVPAMRLLDNKSTPPKQIEHKPDEPPPNL
jgi:hypothetical protein